MNASIGVVAIGRNEGDRLRRCLASLQGKVDTMVYVDSGSTDDSLAFAEAAGAIVVELDMSEPFNPARGRRDGFNRLMDEATPTYVQFVDGDCEVQDGWLETAAAFLDDHPDVAVVCGRRRERFPDASIWNLLIDMEWDTPIGEAKACGGDALMRADIVRQVGGFDPRMVSGEEADLCLRIRQLGLKVWRLDAEMTLHDAAMTRASQWWRRTRRSGRGFAESVAAHGASPERHKVTEMWRAVIWGLGIPLLAVLGAVLLSPWALLLLLAWPAQILRLIARGEVPIRAVFLTIGKFPEALGVMEVWLKRLMRMELRMLNYK